MIRPVLLTRNFMLKTFSLVVALLIFLFVSVESATPVEVDFKLEVNPPDGMVVTNEVPDFVHVTLRGPWANVRSFDSEDLKPVVLDLAETPPGELSRPIDLSLVRPPGGMTALSVRPEKVELNLDFRVERSVPVEADIIDRPAFGFDILAVHIEPKEVRVVGPRSKVGTLDFVSTRPLAVDGQTEDVTLEADLRTPAVGVRLLERRVRVVIEINEEFVTRSFANVRVSVDNAPQGIRIAPNAVTVSLKGPRRLVDNLDPTALEVYVDAQPEVDEGRRSFEKVVALRAAPERTVLVNPIPNVVLQVPKSRRRRR